MDPAPYIRQSAAHAPFGLRSPYLLDEDVSAPRNPNSGTAEACDRANIFNITIGVFRPPAANIDSANFGQVTRRSLHALLTQCRFSTKLRAGHAMAAWRAGPAAKPRATRDRETRARGVIDNDGRRKGPLR